MSYVSRFILRFEEDDTCTTNLPKGCDIIHAQGGQMWRDGECEVEIYAVTQHDPNASVRLDPRTFYRVRQQDVMAPQIGKGDHLISARFVVCYGGRDCSELWHIFVGQYDRGVMTKSMPAQHRAITKVPVND
jgi:hypothetical protein